MVFRKQTCLENMDGHQNNWRELLDLPKDQRLEDSTKKRLIAEYEVKTGKNGGKRQLSRIPLWYFLHEMLDAKHKQSMISWIDSKQLIFTIKKPKDLATIWGAVKNKNKGTMTYAKLARGIRYYYGKGVIEKFPGKRFCYQFILSKKTKSVLSKHSDLNIEEITIKEEEGCDVKKYKTLKRKASSTTPSRLTKRRRSSLSTASSVDSNESRDCSSDEDDNEFKFSADWNVLDTFISDIFNDQLKMKELFSDMQTLGNNNNNDDDTNKQDGRQVVDKKMFEKVYGIKIEENLDEDCNKSKPFEDIPSDLLNFCDDINEMIKQESHVSIQSSDQFDTPYQNMNLLENYSSHNKTSFEIPKKQPLCRKRSKSETTKNQALLNSAVIYEPICCDDSAMNLCNDNNVLFTPGLHVSRSLPDFSFLQTLMEGDTTESFTNQVKKDLILEPLEFEKSFIENIL